MHGSGDLQGRSEPGRRPCHENADPVVESRVTLDAGQPTQGPARPYPALVPDHDVGRLSAVKNYKGRFR